MAELTSKSLLEKNLNELKRDRIISDYNFKCNDGEVNQFDGVEIIVNQEKSFTLDIDSEELDGEDGEIKKISQIENYWTYTDTTISFLLQDEQSTIKLGEEKTIKINIGSNINVSLRKDRQAYGILLANFSKILDLGKVLNGNSYTLPEIVKDSIVVGVLNTTQSVKKDEVDIIIDSVKLQMIYHNKIILKELMNLKLSSLESTSEVIIENISAKLYKDRNPLTFFLFAETVEYPHLRYLEYYHVLEYYFLHKRIKDVEKVIKDLIDLELSNKIDKTKDSYYTSLVNIFEMYYTREDKDTSEQEQLEYVIEHDIGYSKLQAVLNNLNLNFLQNQACELSGTAIGVIKNNDDLFNKGSNGKLKLCDDQVLVNNFCRQLANRIYKVRNFIVHSKKYERSKVFTPTKQNLNSLKSEIELIRLIAYTLLNKYE